MKTYKVMVEIDSQTKSLVGIYTSLGYAIKKANELALCGNAVIITNTLTGKILVVEPS